MCFAIVKINLKNEVIVWKILLQLENVESQAIYLSISIYSVLGDCFNRSLIFNCIVYTINIFN